MTIYLAYDGSVNGDWIAPYAVQAARHRPTPRLRVVHVENAEISGKALAEKFDTIRHIAGNAHVDVDFSIIPMRHGVFGGLIEKLPEGVDTAVICGLRVRGGRRGFLAGTVSEQLLRHQKYTVVALRVVQPGLLGVVRRLLLPVAGHRPGTAAAHVLLELLVPTLSDVRLLHVVRVSGRRFRRLSAAQAGALRHDAAPRMDILERDIAAGIDLGGTHLDIAVRVSDNWASEALIEAAHMRADLIALEASTQTLATPMKFGDPVEKILRNTPCDAAIYRGPR